LFDPFSAKASGPSGQSDNNSRPSGSESRNVATVIGPHQPAGEVLFATGATTNLSSYSNPQATKLIDDTISAPASQEAQELSDYATFMAQQLPVIYQPTSIGLYTSNAGTLVSGKVGGFAADSFTYLTPEAWYLTK
jgi:hypothetical protein